MESRVFVSTFEEYNAGRINGGWIDITDMDRDDFEEAVEEMIERLELKGEEIMIQDAEGNVKNFVSDSGISDDFFDIVENYDEDDQEIIFAYKTGVGDETPEEIMDSYIGTYSEEEDFVNACVDEGLMGDIPEKIKMYIDYESLTRDIMMDYNSVDAENGDVYIFRA